jgi:hypothetical protein
MIAMERAEQEPPTILETLIAELLDTRIMCVGCAAEAHKATSAGVPDSELPPVRLANVIAGGNGSCWAHIQFVDRALAPGQLPSGLLIPGQAV